MPCLLALVTLLFLPLGAVPPPAKAQRVGHWQSVDGAQTIDLTFRADGTFSGSVTKAGTLIWRFAGRWTLKEDVLLTTSATPSWRVPR